MKPFLPIAIRIRMKKLFFANSNTYKAVLPIATCITIKKPSLPITIRIRIKKPFFANSNAYKYLVLSV